MGNFRRTDPIIYAIREIYGERCKVFETNCVGCQAWKLYDEMKKAMAALDQALPCEVTVAPATRFGKGVKVGTVMACLERRRLECQSWPPPKPYDFDYAYVIGLKDALDIARDVVKRIEARISEKEAERNG